MGHQYRLHLGRAKPLAGHLDRVVGAAEDVPHAVLVDGRPVAMDPHARPARPVGVEIALPVAPEAARHADPRGADDQLAHLPAHGLAVAVHHIGGHAGARRGEGGRLQRQQLVDHRLPRDQVDVLAVADEHLVDFLAEHRVDGDAGDRRDVEERRRVGDAVEGGDDVVAAPHHAIAPLAADGDDLDRLAGGGQKALGQGDHADVVGAGQTAVAGHQDECDVAHFVAGGHQRVGGGRRAGLGSQVLDDLERLGRVIAGGFGLSLGAAGLRRRNGRQRARHLGDVLDAFDAFVEFAFCSHILN